MKNTKRALRRHHFARVKSNRKNYWGGDEKTARQMGLLAHTAALCSCWMCGNPRRWGDVTIQELRFGEIEKYFDKEQAV